MNLMEMDYEVIHCFHLRLRSNGGLLCVLSIQLRYLYDQMSDTAPRT